jgi:hypothetical protein
LFIVIPSACGGVLGGVEDGLIHPELGDEDPRIVSSRASITTKGAMGPLIRVLTVATASSRPSRCEQLAV